MDQKNLRLGKTGKKGSRLNSSIFYRDWTFCLMMFIKSGKWEKVQKRSALAHWKIRTRDIQVLAWFYAYDWASFVNRVWDPRSLVGYVRLTIEILVKLNSSCPILEKIVVILYVCNLHKYWLFSLRWSHQDVDPAWQSFGRSFLFHEEHKIQLEIQSISWIGFRC